MYQVRWGIVNKNISVGHIDVRYITGQCPYVTGQCVMYACIPRAELKITGGEDVAKL